jgi:hypothetical protein
MDAAKSKIRLRLSGPLSLQSLIQNYFLMAFFRMPPRSGFNAKADFQQPREAA